jgi:hypothetical protein
MWSQFMNLQGPMMQGMMSNYIEQSKNLFVQMQEQMQNQAKSCSARSRSTSRTRSKQVRFSPRNSRAVVSPPRTVVKAWQIPISVRHSL